LHSYIVNIKAEKGNENIKQKTVLVISDIRRHLQQLFVNPQMVITHANRFGSFGTLT